MADDIGGIRSEVTADTSPLFAALQQAAAEMRRWDQQYGKLTVQITAQMPTQQMMQQTHRNITELLTKQGALQIPINLVAPSQEDVRRAHGATAQNIQATAGNAPPAQIARPVVAPAAVAAQASGPSDAERHAAAQAEANRSPGKTVQYQRGDGTLVRVTSSVAGAAGAAGGFALGGQPLGPTGGAGPREFLGGQGFNVPGLQEELGRATREIERLRGLIPNIGGGGPTSNEANYRRSQQQAGRQRIDLMNAAKNDPNLGVNYRSAYRVSRAETAEFDRLDAEEQAARAQHTGLAAEVFDAAIKRGLTPEQANAEVALVMSDEDVAPAAAGGAGGGGGGRRRRAAAAPPPPPERPRRASTRRSTSDYTDEELIAAYRAAGRPPTITPTQLPGGGEPPRISELTGQMTIQQNRGGSPFRSALTGQIISEEQYRRELNAFKGRTTTEQRPPLVIPQAAERAEAAHLAEAATPARTYTGPGGEQQEIDDLMGLNGPAAQRSAQVRADAAGVSSRRGGRGRGAGGGPTRIPRIGPEERARISAENPEIAENEAFLRQSRELAEQARAGTQQRSLGTFITGLVQAGEGRPAAVLNIRELDRANSELNKRITEQKDAQGAAEASLVRLGTAKRIAAGETKGLTAEQVREAGSVENAQKAYDGYIANLKTAENATKQARNAVTETAKTLDQGAGAFRGLAAGFVGGLAGSLAYGIGITAVTAGIDLFTKATERGVNVLTGQIGVSQRVTDALSDQARAQHGLTSVAVAESFAQSGLASSVGDTIRPLIEQRTALEAGSKAFGEQVDLLRTFQNLSNQQGAGLPGITRGTGGVLGSQLFAQPGIAQQLAGLTPGGQGREAGGVIGAAGGALVGAGIGAAFGGIGALPGALIGGAIGGLGGFAVGRELGSLGGLAGLAQGVGGPTPTRAPGTAPQIGGVRGLSTQSPVFTGRQPVEQAEALEPNNVIAYRLAIEQLNEAAERGVPGVTQFGGAIAQATGPNAQRDIDRTQQVLAEGLGLDPAQAKDLASAGFAIQGIAGLDFRGGIERATALFEAAGRGAAIPDSTEVLTRLREQVIPARIFQANAQTALQNRLTDVQAGIATAAAPPLAVGATIPGGVGALSPEARGLFAGTQALQNLQVGRIEAARVEISNLTAPLGRGFQQGALGAFDQLQGLGQQAAGLQSFIVQQQVGLQTAQFDEQIRLANLQVSDLASTLNTVLGTQHAITDSSYDNLGAYQGQLILLQRQSAQLQLNNAQLGLETEQLNLQLNTLQLQLQQRQINFRVALAGFTAPGVTSEERAANIEQAEKEARFAQRQLDIRKQILQNQREALQNQRQQVGIQAEALPLQFKVQDITLQRDYVTAQNALELLTRARQVTIDVAGAQEALQRVNNEIGRVQNRLNNYVQRAAEFQSQLVNDQAEFIQTYSDSTRTLLARAQEFLGGISTGYSDAINDYLESVTTTTLQQMARLGVGGSSGGNLDPVTGRPTQSGPQRTAQEGFVGHVGQRTQFTIGEAGGEEVAILRNPRQMSMGGGGTQISFNIVINNPNVRSNNDMETMARTIADAVEQRLNRRTALLGFRP